MTRLALVRLLVIVAVSAAAILLRADPEHARPPHGFPPVSAGLPGPPSEVNAAEVAAWIEGQQRGEWITAELARLAQEAQDEARAVAVRRVVPQAAASPAGDCGTLATQFGIPAATIQRESGCSVDAYNPSGCSGRGCIGAVQLDAGHFAAVSPWNPNVPGVCYGLDAASVADQIACAGRLPASAW